MQQDKTSQINEKKITLCSLIPGMGQFVNGQTFKGIRFFRNIRPIHWSDVLGRISCIDRIGYFGKYTNGRSFIIYFD